jgi:hypothetical protein
LTPTGGPSFERFAWSLVAVVIALTFLAGLLSHLLLPIILLAIVVAVLRLVIYYTRQL